jgi:hypothetical protein
VAVDVAIGLIRAQEKQRDGRRDKARRKKKAAAKRGKKRAPETIEKIRKAKLGTTASASTRKKMSESHKRRGTRLPANRGRPKKTQFFARAHRPKRLNELAGRYRR